MTENEALSKMIPPGQHRPGKPNGGVVQIILTRSCDKSCYSCTQGSNLAGPTSFMSLTNFAKACESLVDYFGVVGIFGGNPALHPRFTEVCEILAQYIPFERRGLWCNHPMGKGKVMARTFNPAVSNLNVHLDRAAYDEFRRDWPDSKPFGLTQDSRHSPPYVAMLDVLRVPCPSCVPGDMDDTCSRCNNRRTVYDESAGWDLISRCPINQHWSAMMGEFRGELRAWFCEIAGAQSILHQHNPKYPDTGMPVDTRYKYLRYGPPVEEVDAWWKLDMSAFSNQVRKHCHDCGVPLQGHGELAQSKDPDSCEQVSATHQSIYRPKRVGRKVELVVVREQLGRPLENMTRYLQNASK